MAANSVSSGVLAVPPPCGRVRCSGISGFAMSHSPSGTIQLHVPRPIPGQRPPHHVGHGQEVISFGGYVWGIRDKLSHLAQAVPVLRGVRFAEHRYDLV